MEIWILGLFCASPGPERAKYRPPHVSRDHLLSFSHIPRQPATEGGAVGIAKNSRFVSEKISIRGRIHATRHRHSAFFRSLDHLLFLCPNAAFTSWLSERVSSEEFSSSLRYGGGVSGCFLRFFLFLQKQKQGLYSFSFSLPHPQNHPPTLLSYQPPPPPQAPLPFPSPSSPVPSCSISCHSHRRFCSRLRRPSPPGRYSTGRHSPSLFFSFAQCPLSSSMDFCVSCFEICFFLSWQGSSPPAERTPLFWQWDSLTAKFSASSNIPFLLLQLPQIILNARNLLSGNHSALLAVPWLVCSKKTSPVLPSSKPTPFELANYIYNCRACSLAW